MKISTFNSNNLKNQLYILIDYIYMQKGFSDFQINLESDNSKDRQRQQQNRTTSNFYQKLPSFRNSRLHHCPINTHFRIDLDHRIHYPEPDLSKISATFGKKDMMIIRLYPWGKTGDCSSDSKVW